MIIFKNKNLGLNFSREKASLTNLTLNNFENKLLASKQIIKPRNKIDEMKIYLWLKFIKSNILNKIIDVTILFKKFCDIIYYQSFFLSF